MTVRCAAALAAFAAALALPAVAQASGTGSISGTAIAGDEPVCVLALGPSGDAVATATTDTAGAYTLTGVPAGAWTVEFVPDDGCLGLDTGFAFEFFRGAATPSASTPVTVVSGQTTSGIDADLPPGATIGGTVTDTSGLPLPAVCVILEDTSGRAVLRQPTDIEGNYTLDQLPPGNFIIQFVDDDCAGERAGFASTYYPDAATPAGAQIIIVGAGTITGPLDATLAALPASSGGGGGGGGTGVLGPGSGGSTRSGSRHALLALMAAAGGRWMVDRHGRLHLRLRCTHAASCSVALIVRRPRELAGRITGGRLLGRRDVLVRAGPARWVTITLRGIHSSRVWMALRLRRGAPLLTTVIPVRWA